MPNPVNTKQQEVPVEILPEQSCQKSSRTTRIIRMTVPAMLIRNLCVHNLQGIDLDLPLRQLIVVTGVSGSGKTSLAFDTLFVEGQRRYLETFSLATRQQLEKFERPAVDRLENIPPAIALRQLAQTGHLSSQTSANSSDFGSLTGIGDHLKLLYLRHGQLVCPNCGQIVEAISPGRLAAKLAQFPSGTRFLVTFPVASHEDQTQSTSDAESRSPRRTVKAAAKKATTKAKPPSKGAERKRQLALWDEFRRAGFRRAIVRSTTDIAAFRTVELAGDFPEKVEVVDLVIDRLTSGSYSIERLMESCETALRAGQGRASIWSLSITGDEDFERYQLDGKAWIRHRYATSLRCQTCHIDFPQPQLSLLDEASSPEFIGESDVSSSADLLQRALQLREVCWRDLSQKTPLQLVPWLNEVIDSTNGQDAQQRDRHMWEAALARVDWAVRLGLGEVPIARRTKDLSGTELRRSRLVPLLAAGLVQTLYVFDEPLAGLDEETAAKVLEAITSLKQGGNSLLLVEHHPLARSKADYLVELGPGAGSAGGQVVFAGLVETTSSFSKDAPQTPLHQASCVSRLRASREPTGWIEREPITLRHLSRFSIRLPLGVLCVVNGLPGAGKSTVVIDSLRSESMSDDLPRLAGQPLFAVDSSPLAGSRSQMVIAMLGLFGEVRSLFAQTPEAKTRQINARFFSLHVAGSGRCVPCKGTGRLATDLTYFEEAEIPCPNCLGRRYRRDALEIRFRGLNMAEVLDLTIADALSHFKGHGKLLQALTMLSRTGLAYLRLGQSLATLSGGERQRVKLSIALGKPSEKSIFVCDEPSLGLHPQDVSQLIDCFQQLVDVGHTVWIADSHPQLVEAADWLITLQKSPQPLGTQITFKGRPNMVK